MSKIKTDKSRYRSRYGGGYVTDAQYITECLCFLIARQEKKQLYDRFWQDAPWSKIFREQIPAANNLLKEFHPEVILAALRHKRCRKISSLRANWLIRPILEAENKKHKNKLKEQQQAVTQTKKPTTNKPRHIKTTKKSLMSRLDEV